MKYQTGEVIDFTNNSGSPIAYGEVVPIGTKRIGIAATPILSGELGTIEVVGVHELAAETGVAFNFGDDLYWDNTNKRLTKTATDNCLAGWSVAAKSSAANLALVKIG